MIEKERIKLTVMQAVGHYFVVFLLLLVCGLTAYSLFEIYVTKTYTGVPTSNELIRTSLPFFIGAIIFYFIQRARLNFYELTIKHSEEEFEEALRRTAAELEWEIEVHQKKYVRAIRNSNWTGSWGEMITIIKDGDRLLLNSICDPDKMTSVASFGWNKKNLKTFSSNLKDTVINDSIDFQTNNNVIKNDFEPGIFSKYPKLEEIKNRLIDLGAIFSLMSGSGATVYGIFENLEIAKKAYKKFPKEYFRFLSEPSF